MNMVDHVMRFSEKLVFLVGPSASASGLKTATASWNGYFLTNFPKIWENTKPSQIINAVYSAKSQNKNY